MTEPSPTVEPFPPRPLQRKLSTIFIIVTLAAAALAGYRQIELDGGFASLFCAWMSVCGVWCILDGFRNRTRWWWSFSLLGLGQVAFWMIVLGPRGTDCRDASRPLTASGCPEEILRAICPLFM